MAEARLEALAESLDDGVLTFNDDGVILGANSAAGRLFDYGRAELIGVDLEMLAPGWSLGAGAFPRRWSEVEGRRRDGALFLFELTINEARGVGARLFVGIVRDLGERRAEEARWRELQAEVAYARRLSAMGEFAAALAHEINQPFSAIATYLRTARWLMQRRPKQRSPEIEDILDKAGAQAMRAGEIVRRMREFMTRGDSVKTVNSMAELVEEARALAFVGGKKADARVKMIADGGDDRVLADRVQIQQVILNLLRNAIEAMEGAERRELTLTTSVADGLVRLDVADRGHGLSESARAALFQPFRSTKASGMGVGLSISRSIVEAHGGRIWADGNPGGGAVFSFALPRAEEERQ